ncbi:MAG TPA: VWA domain-containing protein [Devosia sp.]|nr:VWA domain-containing protein [Devosia sp.]
MTDDKMTDETLSSLRRLRPSAPSPERKKLALNAAMLAFDAAHGRTPAEPARRGWLRRWTVGAGLAVPLGTAVAALVLLPLGTQLLTATSRHTQGTPPEPQVSIASGDLDTGSEVAANANPSALSGRSELKAKSAPVMVKPSPPKEAETDAPIDAGAVTAQAGPLKDQLAAPVPPAPEAARSLGIAAAPATNAGIAALGGGSPQTGTVPMQPGDTFQSFDENRVKVTKQEPVSTFSIDVDTASYSYVRGLLKDGYLPDPNAVRLEELINYFPYAYPAPASLETPFKATMAIVPTPWNAKTKLLEIGIMGFVPPAAARKPMNLTFLIDTSGSMDEPNKLPLLKRSFGLLVDSLAPDDTVSIVTYAGSAGVALRPTKASDRSTILSALDQMVAEGSTDGVDGIALAYRVNAEARGEGTINRVILATDGDFNVGIDTPDALKAYIKTERDKGIGLSVLGFGRGNLDDALMQALAQNGNGNASYIDSFQEAQKVLVEEGGANLVTIAKDVKIQVEFNPAQVSEYRLIGYETRALNREDFNNDAVDAGEIGAGHTVTAIYEITPAGSGGELNDPLRYAPQAAAPSAVSDEVGFLKIRYKTPDGDVSRLIETPITGALEVPSLAAAGPDQRFAAAVAAFGQKLKGSNYGEAMSWDAIRDLANGARGEDRYGYRAEFVQLIGLAALLAPDGPTPRAPDAEPVPAAPAPDPVN